MRDPVIAGRGLEPRHRVHFCRGTQHPTAPRPAPNSCHRLVYVRCRMHVKNATSTSAGVANSRVPAASCPFPQEEAKHAMRLQVKHQVQQQIRAKEESTRAARDAKFEEGRQLKVCTAPTLVPCHSLTAQTIIVRCCACNRTAIPTCSSAHLHTHALIRCPLAALVPSQARMEAERQRLLAIKERKLAELESAGVPAKYRIELAMTKIMPRG